ncbi:methylated-DNA--[protein]-cysteine S-methyltransferase [Candidatus Desulfovibrio trichonymphae]|nr:methylated-DNA--[protein]-cysteine S-methyltransferase [Candidatus Desulfovibrio trichonymphae]GHV00481.1 methylated-DNA--protein-cysteine methyltransferase [Deltaproteobacteria bacterium]
MSNDIRMNRAEAEQGSSAGCPGEAGLFHAVVCTAVGRIHIEADTDAIHRLYFCGDKPRTSPSCAVLNEACAQTLAYINGKLRAFDLPVKTRGTPFQQAVWRELCAISYGQTRTYGEVAEHLGNRNRARAVGGAANANPVALIIPCHRMIGAKGALTGFAGGFAVKQALLDLEQRFNGGSATT